MDKRNKESEGPPPHATGSTEPNIVAREAAEKLMCELEEAGYLDFDGGEQEERTDWLNRFTKSYLAAMERARAAQPQPSYHKQRSELEKIEHKLKHFTGQTFSFSEVEFLFNALAAERQLVQWCEVHAPTKDEPIKCCPCCEAVDERKRSEQAKQDAKDKLLPAQAAIEKHNEMQDQFVKAMDTIKNHNWLRCSQIKADLSALREHDAEIKQRLVDGLQSIASDCEEVSKDDSVGAGEKRAWVSIAKRARALAKVKERE